MSPMMGIFVPITMFLVIGIVWVTYIYFRSKEKQMMIEKGMSYEQMVEFIKERKNPFTLLKIGIICIFFGLGLGLGVMVEDYSHNDGWVVLLMFVFTGIGFVVAYYSTKKYEVDNRIK